MEWNEQKKKHFNRIQTDWNTVIFYAYTRAYLSCIWKEKKIARFVIETVQVCEIDHWSFLWSLNRKRNVQAACIRAQMHRGRDREITDTHVIIYDR